MAYCFVCLLVLFTYFDVRICYLGFGLFVCFVTLRTCVCLV